MRLFLGDTYPQKVWKFYGKFLHKLVFFAKIPFWSNKELFQEETTCLRWRNRYPQRARPFEIDFLCKKKKYNHVSNGLGILILNGQILKKEEEEIISKKDIGSTRRIITWVHFG